MFTRLFRFIWSICSRAYQWMHGETHVGVGISTTIPHNKSHGVAMIFEGGQRFRVNIIVDKPKHLYRPSKSLINQLYSQFDKMGLRCVGLVLTPDNQVRHYFPRPTK